MKDNRFFTFCILDFISIIFILILIFTNNFYNFLDGLILLLIFVLMFFVDLGFYIKSFYKDKK